MEKKRPVLKSEIIRTSENHYTVTTEHDGPIEHHFSDDDWHQLKHLRSGMTNCWTTYAHASILNVGYRTYGGFTAYGLVQNAQECVVQLHTLTVAENEQEEK